MSAECRQLPFQQVRITEIQFYQPAQVGDAVDVDVLAVQPEFFVFLVGNLYFHADVRSAFQVDRQSLTLFRGYGERRGRHDQGTVQRDIPQPGFPSLLFVIQCRVNLERYTAEFALFCFSVI